MLCFGFWGVLLPCGVFVSCFASVWNPEFSAQLDLDDRQGFIASSAMQQKKKIPPAFRDVLRNKRVLVGCGGGFHQECQQPYSPVASWMEDTDVALNDEGQQYGNLDEASAIARAPRKCLVIWEVSPDLLVRVLVELVANYWSWPGGGGGTTPQPQN